MLINNLKFNLIEMFFTLSLPYGTNRVSVIWINKLIALRERTACSKQHTNHKHSLGEKHGIL
jgi:hypothetical protein